MSNLERVAQFNLIKELYKNNKITFDTATEYIDKLSIEGLSFSLLPNDSDMESDSYESSYEDSYDSYDE